MGSRRPPRWRRTQPCKPLLAPLFFESDRPLQNIQKHTVICMENPSEYLPKLLLFSYFFHTLSGLAAKVPPRASRSLPKRPPDSKNHEKSPHNRPHNRKRLPQGHPEACPDALQTPKSTRLVPKSAKSTQKNTCVSCPGGVRKCPESVREEAGNQRNHFGRKAPEGGARRYRVSVYNFP